VDVDFLMYYQVSVLVTWKGLISLLVGAWGAGVGVEMGVQIRWDT